MLQQPNPRKVKGLHGTTVLRRAAAAPALQGGLVGPTAGPEPETSPLSLTPTSLGLLFTHFWGVAGE